MAKVVFALLLIITSYLVISTSGSPIKKRNIPRWDRIFNDNGAPLYSLPSEVGIATYRGCPLLWHCKLKSCMYGFKLDKYGCKMCQCCPKLSNCRISCPTVFERVDGCRICECAEEGVYGKFDHNRFGGILPGFPEEEEEEESFDAFITPDMLKEATKKKLKKVAVTKGEDCVTPICLSICEYGYKRDHKGCILDCSCRKKPFTKCPVLDCQKPCSHGLQRDENDCDICKCVDNSINNVLTSVEIDRQPNVNTDGTTGKQIPRPGSEITGEQIPRPGTGIPGIRPFRPDSGCLALRDCRIQDNCRFGLKQDKDGCDICECVEGSYTGLPPPGHNGYPSSWSGGGGGIFPGNGGVMFPGYGGYHNNNPMNPHPRR